jgi:hypothetical protein
LVEAAGPKPGAGVNQDSSVRVNGTGNGNVNAGEELLLNQMRFANASLYWSGLQSMASMRIG